VPLLIGSAVGGAGFGVAFLGALRNLSAAIPPDHRAGVMSAFFLVAYTALSVPAVLAGLAVTSLGLSATFAIFGAAVAALALFVALRAWRSRPRRAVYSPEPCGRPTGSDPQAQGLGYVAGG
jgi:predicted MFS family arabinose efflux permease